MSSLKKGLYALLYVICFIFILGGAVNNGVSTFYMAIPFMLVFILIASEVFKNKICLYFSVFIVALSMLVNFTLEYNPLVYPILKDGSVELLTDARVNRWGTITEFNAPNNPTSDDHPLRKGAIIPVQGVTISNSDFNTRVIIDTEYGSFYDDRLYIANKELQSEWSVKLGNLMTWPYYLMDFFFRFSN